MTDTVVPFVVEPLHHQTDNAPEWMQVNVYIKADVLAPAIVQRRANVWLSMNAGHLLLAEKPELVLREPLQWRFEVIYSLPDRSKPGSVRRTYLGRMQLDAISGEVIDPEQLIKQLAANRNMIFY